MPELRKKRKTLYTKLRKEKFNSEILRKSLPLVDAYAYDGGDGDDVWVSQLR